MLAVVGGERAGSVVERGGELLAEVPGLVANERDRVDRQQSRAMRMATAPPISASSRRCTARFDPGRCNATIRIAEAAAWFRTVSGAPARS